MANINMNQEMPLQMEDLDWMNSANLDDLILDDETMAALMAIPVPQTSDNSSLPLPPQGYTSNSPPPPYSEAPSSAATVPHHIPPLSIPQTPLPSRTPISSVPGVKPRAGGGSGGTKKWASEEDWDRHRPTITRLYVKENKRLWQLLEYMEREHQFYAT